MAMPLGPSGAQPPAEPQPVAKVSAEGKLCLSLGNISREIKVKYGDEALTDTYQLEKMASLINKHYDTKKLYNELFNKAGNKLTLGSGGITNMTGEKIAAGKKGFKREEAIPTHHDRKLAELETSMKKSVAFGKEVAKLGEKYPDAVVKRAIGYITSQTGTDLKKALNGGVSVNVPQARLLHAKHNEGLLNTLLALKNRPDLGRGTQGTYEACRTELLKLLNESFGIALPENLSTDTFQAIAKSENLTDAKDKIRTFLTGTLKVPNVDENLNLTQSISHYKLGDKEGNKTRLEHINDKIASLEGEVRQPAATNDQKQSIFLQLHVLRQMKQLWELYRGSPEPLPLQARSDARAASDHLVLEIDPNQPPFTLPPRTEPLPEALTVSRPLPEPRASSREKSFAPEFLLTFDRWDAKGESEKKEILSRVVKCILTVDEIEEVMTKYSTLLTNDQRQLLVRQRDVRLNFEELQRGDDSAKRRSIVELLKLDLYPDEIDYIISNFSKLLTPEQYTSLTDRFTAAVRKSRIGLQKLDAPKLRRIGFNESGVPNPVQRQPDPHSVLSLGRRRPVVEEVPDVEEVNLDVVGDTLRATSADKEFDEEEDEFTIVADALEPSTEVRAPELSIQQADDNPGVFRSVMNKIANVFKSRKPPTTPPT